MKEIDKVNITNSITMTLYVDVEGKCNIHNCLTGKIAPKIIVASLEKNKKFFLEINVPIIMVANIYPKKNIATINPSKYNEIK